MKRNLTKSILGGLALTMLATLPVDAQVTTSETLSVANDVSLRNDNEKNAATAYPKESALEMRTSRNEGTISVDFVGLMSFDIPYKSGYAIKSATLRLVTERAKGTMNIYALDAEVSDADTYSSQENNLAVARNKEPLASVKLKGTNDKAVTDGGASSVLADWVNEIDLTAYIQTLGHGKCNLMLANAAESTTNAVKVFSSDAKDVTNSKVTPNFTFAADDLKPQLTLVYEEVQNQLSKVLNPTSDTWIRLNNKTNQATATNMELQSYTNEADASKNVSMLGLMSFDLPEEVSHSNYEVSKASLRLVTKRIKGDRMVNVYKYDAFEENTVYETEAKNVAASMVNNNLLTTFKAEGKADADITSDAIVNTDFTNIAKWTTNVDLTEAVKGLSDAKFNILLAKQKDEAKATQIFTKEAKDFENKKNPDAPIAFAAADLVPQLTVEYALATYVLNVTGAGAATLVLPYETTIPENVKAYTLNYTSGNKATATELTQTIPANTPVLVNAAAGKYTFTATTTLTTKAESTKNGSLVGAWAETSVPADAYVLQNQNGVVAFYKVSSGSNIQVKANQAYLVAPAAQSRSIDIDFGGTTGISQVAADKQSDDAYYTLSGIRVSKSGLQKNQIYIHNGKAFVVK